MIRKDFFEDVAATIGADTLGAGKRRKRQEGQHESALEREKGDSSRAILLHDRGRESGNNLYRKYREELGFSSRCRCVLSYFPPQLTTNKTRYS